MKKNKIEHYSDKEALEFHNSNKSGKIEIISSKPMTTKRDLALAYSPGVAVPVKAISKNPDLAYEYTTKGNLVWSSPWVLFALLLNPISNLMLNIVIPFSCLLSYWFNRISNVT